MPRKTVTYMGESSVSVKFFSRSKFQAIVFTLYWIIKVLRVRKSRMMRVIQVWSNRDRWGTVGYIGNKCMGFKFDIQSFIVFQRLLNIMRTKLLNMWHESDILLKRRPSVKHKNVRGKNEYMFTPDKCYYIFQIVYIRLHYSNGYCCSSELGDPCET